MNKIRITTSAAALIALFSLPLSSYAATTVTKVTGYSATNGCTVSSIAGGYNFEIFGINCPSEPQTIYTEKSYGPWGSCSIKMASPSNTYYVSGSCSSYRVKKN